MPFLMSIFMDAYPIYEKGELDICDSVVLLSFKSKLYFSLFGLKFLIKSVKLHYFYVSFRGALLKLFEVLCFTSPKDENFMKYCQYFCEILDFSLDQSNMRWEY